MNFHLIYSILFIYFSSSSLVEAVSWKAKILIILEKFMEILGKFQKISYVVRFVSYGYISAYAQPTPCVGGYTPYGLIVTVSIQTFCNHKSKLFVIISPQGVYMVILSSANRKNADKFLRKSRNFCSIKNCNFVKNKDFLDIT